MMCKSIRWYYSLFPWESPVHSGSYSTQRTTPLLARIGCNWSWEADFTKNVNSPATLLCIWQGLNHLLSMWGIQFRELLLEIFRPWILGHIRKLGMTTFLRKKWLRFRNLHINNPAIFSKYTTSGLCIYIYIYMLYHVISMCVSSDPLSMHPNSITRIDFGILLLHLKPVLGDRAAHRVPWRSGTPLAHPLSRLKTAKHHPVPQPSYQHYLVSYSNSDLK